MEKRGMLFRPKMRLLGEVVFNLYGDATQNSAHVTIETKRIDQSVPSDYQLVSRSWLLMIEYLLTLVDKFIFDTSIGNLEGAIFTYFKYQALQTKVAAEDKLLLALRLNLLYNKKLMAETNFLHAPEVRNLGGYYGLLMFSSFWTVSNYLPTKIREDTLYAMLHAIRQWKSNQTVSYGTWDFLKIAAIVESEKSYLHHLNDQYSRNS